MVFEERPQVDCVDRFLLTRYFSSRIDYVFRDEKLIMFKSKAINIEHDCDYNFSHR